MKSFVIITALPFRRQGNQSMLRFVKMLIAHNNNVHLFTTGSDENGELVLEDSRFAFKRLPSFGNWMIGNLKSASKAKTATESRGHNFFDNVKSEVKLPPFGSHTFRTSILKWFYFLLSLIDNCLIFWRLVFRYSDVLKRADAIVAYEFDNALVARWLSFFFRKKLITKYQGVILKATERNIGDCYRYYPGNYIGIVKSDLCIMVNDGTDGEYYARKRGNTNVLFITHGVSDVSHPTDNVAHLESIIDGRFLIFNNASGSLWKRVDRSMRFLNHLSPAVRNQVVVLSTYFGPYAKDLEEYVGKIGIGDSYHFVKKLSGAQCNNLIKRSDALLMTNDISNLGNPVLEALYEGTPVISIEDGSLDGVVESGNNGILIALDTEFDVVLARAIERLVTDREYLKTLKQNAAQSKNRVVFDLKIQQEKEYREIEKLFE